MMARAPESAAGSGDEVVRLAARAYEPDRYLSALLAPRGIRSALVALAAFGGEVARIPVYVDEAMMGEIRLQWWRDAIDGIFVAGESTGNPIADGLGRALGRDPLAVPLLQGVVDAHAARLSPTPFADMQALVGNLARSEGALFALAWRVASAGSGEPEPEAIADAGLAYGLARTLFELPASLAHGTLLLPADRLEGLDAQSLRRGEGRSALARTIAEVEARVQLHFLRVRSAWPSVPRPVHVAVRPIALVRPYLRACEGLAETPSIGRDVLPLTRVWRLWRAGAASGL